jgi:hypothetical protein
MQIGYISVRAVCTIAYMYLYLSHARSPSPSSKNVIRRPDAFDQDQAPTSPQVTWGGACTSFEERTREFLKLSAPNIAFAHMEICHGKQRSRHYILSCLPVCIPCPILPCGLDGECQRDQRATLSDVDLPSLALIVNPLHLFCSFVRAASATEPPVSPLDRA